MADSGGRREPSNFNQNKDMTDQLIQKAKTGDKEAMLQLIEQFSPLFKRKACFYYQMGSEYEDIYQQSVLYFITGVYQYTPMPPVTFAGYIKKRLKWGLWTYFRKMYEKGREK